MKKSLLAARCALIAAASLLTACMSKEYRTAEGVVWSTTYHITYSGDRSLDDSIQEVFVMVERSLSPFADNSLITRINRGDTTVVADSLLSRVFLASQEVSRLSAGMFDPTVAPLINLWGFGYKDIVKDGLDPDSADIAEALQKVGIQRCSLLPDGRIAKADPEMEFNFSAITKGYACDLVGDMLRRNGVTDYMVEIGGEVALAGKNPSGKTWNIMIEAPVDADTISHNRMAVIAPEGRSVATSGNYRNFRDTSSGRHGHTISPVTGRPVATSTLSATVLAPTCIMADALATACMTLPADQALKMIAQIPDTDVLLVVADTTASAPWRLIPSPNFPTLQ